MTQCNLCMIWFHDKCAGIKKSDNVGWWCCDRCRQMTANVSILMRCNVRSRSPWPIVFWFQTRRLSLTLRAAGSHRFGAPDRTCLQGIRTGLQDLTGSEPQIEHAYEVSGRCCRMSWNWNNRSNMPTRYQVGAAGSRVGNTRSNMHTGFQDGATGSQGFGAPNRTLLRSIMMGLQNLTSWEHRIEHTYEVSGRSSSISRVGNYRSYMPTRYQEGTLGSHGFEIQIERAYQVSERCCRISRARNTISYMPIRYQDGCGITRVRNIRSNMPTRYQDGAAGSQWFGTTDPRCLRGIRMGL